MLPGNTVDTDPRHPTRFRYCDGHMHTLLKFSPRLAYSALDLVKIPIPTSMPTLTRKLGSARRRSLNPLHLKGLHLEWKWANAQKCRSS